MNKRAFAKILKQGKQDLDPERPHAYRASAVRLALHGRNQSSLIVIGDIKENMGEMLTCL